MNNKNPVIFSHADCMDGLAAAWALWTVFGSAATYAFCRHDRPVTPAPDVTDRDVYFVDFSAPRQALIDMSKIAASITIVDHHKTAQAALDNTDGWMPANVTCVFDMSKSGAMLAYELAHRLADSAPLAPNETAKIVNYVQDRDLWQWKLPNSRAVSAYLASIEPTIASFDAAAYRMEDPNGLAEIIACGTTLIADQDKRITRAAKAAYRMTDRAGNVVYLCNTTQLISEIGAALLALHRDAAYAAMYFDTYKDGQCMRVFSLRGRADGFDVSAVAALNGGGGHAAAAGFSVLTNGTPQWHVASA